MPGQDRRGPMGQGPRTGRKMGLCNTNNQIAFGYGRGFGGRGRGMGFMNRFGNFFGFGRQVVSEQQDLQNYVSDLEEELKEAKEALKNISDSKNSQGDK
ncbi:MAG: DUF5320 domain-containing protein [bacterium]